MKPEIQVFKKKLICKYWVHYKSKPHGVYRLDLAHVVQFATSAAPASAQTGHSGCGPPRHPSQPYLNAVETLTQDRGAACASCGDTCETGDTYEFRPPGMFQTHLNSSFQVR